jgi:Leucine-rich repeat (LRR) protein
MGDAITSQILNFLLQTIPTAIDVDVGIHQHFIGQLILSNNSLSKVPDEIRQFNHLSFVDLRFNHIRSVASGSFKFPMNNVKIPGKVDLSFNRIKTVEQGAFQGKYLMISLNHNRLIRFDSKVFKSVLQDMSRVNRSQGINIEQSILFDKFIYLLINFLFYLFMVSFVIRSCRLRH